MQTALSCDELLRYSEAESQKWEQFFRSNPAALDVKIDNIALATSVRELVKHIVAVDLRYSERLREMRITQYEEIANDVDTLFTLARKAHQGLREYTTQASEQDWATVIDFPTRSLGTLQASRKKIFFHTLLHAVRHWAQLAVLLRVAGFKQDWQHDLLMSDAID